MLKASIWGNSSTEIHKCGQSPIAHRGQIFPVCDEYTYLPSLIWVFQSLTNLKLASEDIFSDCLSM